MNMNSTRPSCDRPLERAEAAAGEDVRMQLGRHRTEHDRTEHEARRHLADDRRLTEVAQHQAEQARGAEDDDELQQERRVAHVRSS